MSRSSSQEDEIEGLLLAQPKRRSRFPTRACLGHLTLIALYTTICVIVLTTRDQKCPQGVNLIESPARDAVSYKRVSMNTSLFDDNPFKGDPRPEQDEAWNSILHYQHIAFKEEDLKKINKTSIKLTDGSGHLGVLDVFHELHCLNYIRKYMHRDYYTLDHPGMQKRHVQHCIDNLRQAIMCHGDISIQTFDWLPDYRYPWPNFEIVHECRDWDQILEWAKKHHVHSLEGPIVTHPTLGVSWPVGG